MGVRRRWTRWIAAGVVAVAVLSSSLALAAASKPKAGDYFSTSPSTEIFVLKGGNAVTLYTSCGPVSELSASWDSPKIPLRKGSFSFDKQTTVTEIQDHPLFKTTPVKATVLFTGTFKDGKFKGKVHLGGSSCPEASYTAGFSTHGGGEGG